MRSEQDSRASRGSPSLRHGVPYQTIARFSVISRTDQYKLDEPTVGESRRWTMLYTQFRVRRNADQQSSSLTDFPDDRCIVGRTRGFPRCSDASKHSVYGTFHPLRTHRGTAHRGIHPQSRINAYTARKPVFLDQPMRDGSRRRWRDGTRLHVAPASIRRPRPACH